MIFFALFIVNSFLNSGLGYVGLSAGFNLDGSLWIGLLSWLFVWSIALLSFSKRDWSWVREWLWIVKVSGV
jgi:hypothetical protein